MHNMKATNNQNKLAREKINILVKNATWFGFMNGLAIGICITIVFQALMHYYKITVNP